MNPKNLLDGYPEFKEWDRPHRQPILAPAKAVMEAWFERGVTYDRDPVLGEVLRAANIMIYTNAPAELRHILESARGKILIYILEWRGVSDDMVPYLLMLIRAIPPAESGLKRELKAAFEQWLVPLPYGPVFGTTNKQPRERAELISDNWYDLQSQHLYSFVSKVYTTKGDELRPRSIRAIEKKLDLQQRLKDFGLSRPERCVYHACQLFQYMEVAEFSVMIGHNMTPEAIRKFHDRIKKKLA